ncbi:hypothetical protein ONZ45_g19133 [Pleurotus djamor]|nr:hypothetical protein ONZ45_g19133 [Pleurotus djamor]
MSASSILATGLRSVANTPFRVDSTRQILQKSTRCYATAQPKMKNNKERRVKPGKHKPPPERDATGALVFKKQEKRGGVFRPLPASQLSHPILQGNEAEQLKLPVFCPTLVTPEMVGKPVAFAIDGSSPFNKFGVTKKTLLEVIIPLEARTLAHAHP